MTVSFQNKNSHQGFSPQPDNKGTVNCSDPIPVDATAGPYFNNDPVQLVAGVVTPHVAGTAGNPVEWVGVITKLYDTNHHLVTNLPDNTAGYAEITIDRDQIYIAIVSGTGYAGVADNGKFYATTAAPSTGANADGRSGYSYSPRMIDSTTENTSGDVQILRLTGAPNNVGGVDGCEVFCKIGSFSLV